MYTNESKSIGYHIALYAMMVFYGVSLLLPGLISGEGTMYGYQVLQIGWLGIFTGVFSWYGYILGIVVFILLRKGKSIAALKYSVVSLFLGLQALYLQMTNAQVTVSEGGGSDSWVNNMGELSTGYYLWILVLILLVIQCLVAIRHNSSSQKVEST